MIDSRADRRMAKRGLAAGLATACLFLLGAEASAAPWQTAQAEPRAVPQPLLLAPPPRLGAPVPVHPLSEDLRPLPEALPAVTVPCSNIGLSCASFSIVVTRGCSS